MTLTAILTLLGAIVPFAIWIYRRHAEKESDPLQQNREAHQQIEKPVTAPSVALSDSLDEYERLRNAHRKQ